VIFKLDIDFNFQDKRWKKLSYQNFKDIAVATIEQAAKKFTDNFEINIIFANSEKITLLNKEYRHKNKDTNVLAFQYVDWTKKLNKHEFLGDIVFSFDKVVEEAEKQKITFSDHLTHLLVHGILHLLGYDHHLLSEARIMQKFEIEVLHSFGIKSPYYVTKTNHNYENLKK
jgi:probable rRNA maturation factor